MLELLTDPHSWAALLTLIALEVILGIDNIVFISILVGDLPKAQQQRARQIGLGLALLMRLLLLFALVWLVGLTEPWFTLFEEAFSGRDLILIAGGLFLLVKATHEIHNSLETESEDSPAKISASFGAVIMQVGLIDMVFSLDSVITAVGLVEHVSLMVIAIIVSVAVMLVLARPLGEFIDKNPTFKMLALGFLLLIGCTLVAEGFDFHIPRGYIYFAMSFSLGVEFLNLLSRKSRKTKPLTLHKKIKSAK